MMKIAIVGAGAVGTHLLCNLAQGAAQLLLVVREAHVAKIRSRGLELSREGRESLFAKPDVCATPTGTSVQDYIFVCLKAYAVAEALPSLAPMIGPKTCVIFVQNGIPWWYRIGDAPASDLLDPSGRLASLVQPEQVIGCVAYINARNVEAGRAHHISDNGYILGRPDGQKDEPIARIASAMKVGDLEPKLTDNIQREIWLKLWGSLAFNPLGALTGAAMDRTIGDGATKPIVVAMMSEARIIAERAGVTFPLTVEQRLEVAAKAGAFKTSMLQDLEAGRPMEIDAILGAVAAAGRAMNIETPTINTVLGLLQQKADILGLTRR